MKAVLDASALLAYLQNEPGSEAVEEVLAESVISSVNWAEVVQKSLAAGVVVEGMREDLASLGLTIAPFVLEDGQVAGQLWHKTRQYQLSDCHSESLQLCGSRTSPAQRCEFSCP